VEDVVWGFIIFLQLLPVQSFFSPFERLVKLSCDPFVVEYKVEKNKPLEMGYRLKKNTLYCPSQGCHSLKKMT
jgi:hypothetical protein